MTAPRHAIIGCGRVAPNHVDGFRAAGWELRWACDRDPDVAATFAGRHAIPRVTASIVDVLADPEVTSVSIAVDHAQHAALADQALRAGKHVLVEKPLALTARDGERLVELAGQRGLILSVVSQHRYDPVVVAVRERLREGLLGRLLYVRSSLEARRENSYYESSYWRGTWAGEGGSALVNQGYHGLDVTRFLCGELQVLAAVAGRAALGEVIETEDTLSALLVAGGTPVTLNVTVGSTTTWRTRLELVGTAGTITFDLDHPGTIHRATGNPELERWAALEQARQVREEPPGVDYYGVSHRRQIADFVAAVRDGTTPAADANVALGMVALLESLYRRIGAPPAEPAFDHPATTGVPAERVRGAAAGVDQ
ncbi:MAG: Gfo/Idh/MocA family protein [Labedaea sp.]